MKKIITIFLLLCFVSTGFSATIHDRLKGVIAKKNAIDTTAPEVSSVTVGTNGTTVTIVFTETVVTTGYDDADFNLDCTATGSDIALNTISGTGNTRTFTAASTIKYHDTCNADYVGSANEIEDATGNDLAGTVTNIASTNNTSYTFPYNVVLDNFNDTESHPMTGWTDLSYGGFSSNGTTAGGASGAGSATARSTAISGDSDIYITISTLMAEGENFALILRSPSGGNGYAAYMERLASHDDLAAILKMVDGTPTTICEYDQEFSAGDSIGMKLTGSSPIVLSFWYKASGGSWTQLCTGNDTTSPYTSTGSTVMSLTGSTTMRVDNFGGGTIP